MTGYPEPTADRERKASHCRHGVALGYECFFCGRVGGAEHGEPSGGLIAKDEDSFYILVCPDPECRKVWDVESGPEHDSCDEWELHGETVPAVERIEVVPANRLSDEIAHAELAERIPGWNSEKSVVENVERTIAVHRSLGDLADERAHVCMARHHRALRRGPLRHLPDQADRADGARWVEPYGVRGVRSAVGTGGGGHGRNSPRRDEPSRLGVVQRRLCESARLELCRFTGCR